MNKNAHKQVIMYINRGVLTMKLKKRPLSILVVIGVMILAGGIYLFNYINRITAYQEAVKNIVYEEINFANIPSGRYIGECNVDIVYAKVEVKVDSGRIAEIKLLEHRQERGSNAEVVLEKIMAEQRIDVDTVAKATNSSKVIKKAVENALKN